MRKKTKERKRLKEYGYAGAYETTLCKDEFVLNFAVDAGFAYGFSEITLLNYVAESYRESSLVLLKTVERIAEYDESKMSKRMPEMCSYGYIPAMFCFRHYVELKLKSLYMTIKRKQFNSCSHNLMVLFEEIKDELGKLPIDISGICETVQYVHEIECANPYHFRYYIDKDFAPTTRISIKYKCVFEDINRRISNFAKCAYAVEAKVAIARNKLVKERGGVWKPEVHGEMTFDVICEAMNKSAP